MNKIQLYKFLSLFFFCILAYSANSKACSFNILPKEQIILNGTKLSMRALDCMIKTSESDYVLNLVSAINTSIVNNLIMPESTIMVLSKASLPQNTVHIELGADATLGISNNSKDFIHFNCKQA